MEEYSKKVLHPSPETEEYLVEEIKKASFVLSSSFCIIYSPLLAEWDFVFRIMQDERLLQQILLPVYTHGLSEKLKIVCCAEEYRERVILAVFLKLCQT